MSHFTVLVITKDGDYESALAPFDENLEVDPYIERTRQQIIDELKERYKKSLEKEDSYITKYYADVDWNNDDSIIAAYRDFHDDEDFDEQGNELSTYNPDSQWDWYSLGGRWNGSLKLKAPTNLTAEEAEIFGKMSRNIKLLQDTTSQFDAICEYNPEYVGTPLKKLLQMILFVENIDNERNELKRIIDNNILDKTIIKDCLNKIFEKLSKLCDYTEEQQEQFKQLMKKAYPNIIMDRGSWISGWQLPDLGTCDHAQVKYIDFSPNMEDAEKAAREWDVIVEGAPQTQEEIDRRKFLFCHTKEYMLDMYDNKEDYIKEQTAFRTYAVLDHGHWIDPGKMGWWGFNDATKESRKWYNKKFEELLNNLDPEDYISVVDCHI